MENMPDASLPSGAMPRNGSASAAFARSPIGCSRGGSSNGRIAGVGALFRRPKFADSPAMIRSSLPVSDGRTCRRKLPNSRLLVRTGAASFTILA